MSYPTFTQKSRFKNKESDIPTTSEHKNTSRNEKTSLTPYRDLGNWAVNRLMESHLNNKDQPRNDLNLQEATTEENINEMVSLLRKHYGITNPDDPVEQEAESVANQIVKMETLDNSQSPGMTDNGANIWKTPKISRRQNEGSNSSNTVDINLPASDGLPLEREVSAYMEPRFGYSFNDVRIHANAQSADMAQSLSARAFSTGRDIYFNNGEYNPQTKAGKKLIAHELTHVVQQGQANQINTSMICRAKIPKKTVTVNVTYLHGGSTNLATHLTKANDIFKRATVEVKSGKTETLDEPKSKVILGADLILDEYTDPKTPTAEEQALFKKNRTANEITMYYVKGMSAGSLGEAFWPATGQPVGFVYASTNSRTWPHELGHVLLDTGSHPADADNFMAQTSVASGKEKITATQITKIRSSAYVK